MKEKKEKKTEREREIKTEKRPSLSIISHKINQVP